MRKTLVLSLLLVFTLALAGLASAAEITVWCWDPLFNIYAMEEAAKIYAEINPDVTINIMAGQLNTLPDILLMQDNALVKNVMNYPGVFYDLTDSGIDFSQFADFKANHTIVEGRNYGVPFDNGAAITALRVDILEEAGYTVDDFTDITWSRFIEIGKDVLEKTGYPLLSAVSESPDHIMVCLQSAGTWMFDENGDVFIADNEVLKETVEVYVELVKSGVLVQVADWEQYIGTLNRGTVAGTINGCWIIGTIVAQPEQEGNWRITNIPRLDAQAHQLQQPRQLQLVDLAHSRTKMWRWTSSSTPLPAALISTDHSAILRCTGNVSRLETAMYSSPIHSSAASGYADITEFAAEVRISYGVYNYEAGDAVAMAISGSAGWDIDSPCVKQKKLSNS